ncbi:hypothetical protein D3C84_716090 [compost metagenome]
MRGHPAPAQHAGGSQGKSAGADRADPSHRAGLLPQPLLQCRVAGDVLDEGTARHQQGVELALVRLDRGIHRQAQAAAALEQPWLGTYHFHPVGTGIAQLLRRLGEDIGGADYVQQLHAGKGQQGDTHGDVRHCR